MFFVLFSGDGLTFKTFKPDKMTSAAVETIYQTTAAAEPDSDGDDDPGKLLNAWLGQLNKVR